jgi:hypothetical protein
MLIPDQEGVDWEVGALRRLEVIICDVYVENQFPDFKQVKNKTNAFASAFLRDFKDNPLGQESTFGT